MPVQSDHALSIKQAVLNSEAFKPEFHLNVGWSTSYDTIFAQKFDDVTDANSILDGVEATGRLVLLGAGGGAKSAILMRVGKRAIARKQYPIPIFLKNWTSAHYDQWKRLSNYSQRLDFLLVSFAPAPIDIGEISELPMSAPRVLLIDGLNEVTEKVGNEILDAVDDYVRYSPMTRAIVSDRFVRRQLKTPDRWRLALLLPLSEEEVAKHAIKAVGSSTWNALSVAERSILRSPYFLDRYLKSKEVRTTRAAELHQFFVTRDALTDAELASVATAAFQQYRAETRTFPLQPFQEMAGEEATRKLRLSGSLIVEDGQAHFDHHLKHDYLVTTYVVASPDRWDRMHFRTMTFSASSFDTVSLAVEQLATERERDAFERALYDWNLYAAGNALADGRAAQFSTEMATVVHGMFAERRWDIFLRSAVAAKDILHVINTPLAQQLFLADSLAEVLEIIGAQPGNTAWFREWKGLYTSPLESEANEADVQRLLDVDSVIGWTTSNVLRRRRLSADLKALVRRYMRQHENPIVRWRAAHVLGKFATDENAQALGEGLSDTASEVKYGCTRSLVEIAARSGGQLAPRIFETIARHATALAAHRDVVEEFRRVVIIQEDQVPPQWTRLVLPAIAALQQATIPYLPRHEWDRTLEELVDRYGY